MPKYKVQVNVSAYKYVEVVVEADNEKEAEDYAAEDIISQAESDDWQIDDTTVEVLEIVPEPAVYNECFDAIVGDYTKE